jgi:hypothetical protein
MLWPEKRDKDLLLGDKVPGMMDRTTETSYLIVNSGYLPDGLRPLLGFGERALPSVFGDNGLKIGPIPKGTPVNLLANLNLLPDTTDPVERLNHDKKVLELLIRLKKDLEKLPRDATDEDAKRVFANAVKPLMELSKCPDYIVNRGHYFGNGYPQGEKPLSDDDKRALIEFLKTF